MRLKLVGAVCSLSALVFAQQALGAPPTVSAISPNNGTASGGTSVTVTGTGFIEGSTVSFGGEPAAGTTVKSSTSITAVSPRGRGNPPVAVTVTNTNGTSATSAADQFAYDPPAEGPWLGLDGNSGGAWAGALTDFTTKNITFDRGGGNLEMTAGALLEEGGKPTEAGKAIATSMEAGMTPDVIINYVGFKGGPFNEDPSFPSTEAKIKTYVEGFVTTASAIHAKYPLAIFEPMNEPWGYTTPNNNGAEYAAVIASLLPAARTAHIPLEEIYVAGYGADKNAKNEWFTPGWIPAMYEAKPALKTEIEGWYFHPYGPTKGTEFNNSEGIESLPEVQKLMTSGQNNIIVSEIGYCAHDVNEGHGCNGGTTEAETSAQAATKLNEVLTTARTYHEAGWLRALLVYARTDGGWAMETSGAKLTKQGETLDSFAEANGSPTWRPLRNAAEAASNGLSGIACVTNVSCIAVGVASFSIGKPTSSPLEVYWNGWEWQTASMVSGGLGLSLEGAEAVSCSAASACTATGYGITGRKKTKPFAERWNGSEWKAQETPEPAETTSAKLPSIACVTSTLCVAVGSYEVTAGELPLAEKWNGSSWSLLEPKVPSGATASELSAVGCSSSTACTAVGKYKTATATEQLIERWNGTTWSIQEGKTPTGGKAPALSGVYCSGENCKAVGKYTTSGGATAQLLEQWTGSTWALQEAPAPGGSKATTLLDVACSAASACTATGEYTSSTETTRSLIERWNGTEWKLQTIPTMGAPEGTEHVTGVSCVSGQFCAASLSDGLWDATEWG